MEHKISMEKTANRSKVGASLPRQENDLSATTFYRFVSEKRRPFP